MSEEVLQPAERLTLGALRYAVNDEAGTYLAIMRLFTAGISGFLSDQSADEIAERLRELGVELGWDDADDASARLLHLDLTVSSKRQEYLGE